MFKAWPEIDWFDAAFYARSNPALPASDAALRDHFDRVGAPAGIPGNPAAMREMFLNLVPDDRPVLEIGPFYSPALHGPHVRYADVLDTQQLRDRAALIGQDPETCPVIDYPLPDWDLDAIGERFAAVFSSHCIEHQADLVQHLQAVERRLHPGGCYFVIVPDKRYCFDHFLPETTVADVIRAQARGEMRHDVGSVIEHLALFAHNDAPRHWAGDHGDADPVERIEDIRNAMRQYQASDGRYIDVHAWKFTPASFRTVTWALHALGLTRLQPWGVLDTVRNRNEFCAVFRQAPVPE